MQSGCLQSAVCLLVFSFLGVTSPAASGQQASVSPQRRAVVPPTVSVAALRVPEKAWKHYRVARSAEQAHHDEQSAREIAKALEIAPGFADAYLLRGARALRLGQHEAAIADATKALELDPAIAWAGIVLAESYNAQGRYQDAVLILANVSGPESTSWQAKYERARAEVGLSHAEESLRWSAVALAAAPPACVDAHLIRANAYQLAHRWTEASREMERYLALEVESVQPRHAQVMEALAHTRQMAIEAEQTLASR